MQAVIKIGSSQYTVQPGQKILALRPQVDSVLMIMDGSTTHVGNPSVKDAVVAVKAMGDVKGKKVRAATYKSKSRERKVRGFRAQYTELLIEDIYIGEKKTKLAKEAEVKEEKVAEKKAVKKSVKAKS